VNETSKLPGPVYRSSSRTGLVSAVAGLLLLLDVAPAASQAIWDEVSGGSPNSDMVALTFDAGSIDGPVFSILDTLRVRDLRVTFFLTGQWVQSYPAAAQQVALDGHELANHTYYHPDLTGLSNAQIIWELDYTNGIIEAELGRTSRPWFRPPFGARNQRVLDIARDLGFRSVYWTLDSFDWMNTATSARVLTRVLGNVGPGDIVVHHVAAYPTAEALPVILDEIHARGLRVVTVSELLGLAPSSASTRSAETSEEAQDFPPVRP
jgi:peptidoglycan/xylan/chitin deacetylase (PgdA/CDA1 family)